MLQRFNNIFKHFSLLFFTVTMSTFFTTNRHGYSVRFSPFNPDQFVVASSQFYGLAGGGTLYFLELSPDGNSIVEKRTHHWTDGLFDVVSFAVAIKSVNL